MPVQIFIASKVGSMLPTASTPSAGLANLLNGVSKVSVAPLVDLLDISSDDAPAPSSSGGDFLQDLLGVDFPPASKQSGTNFAPQNGTSALLDLLSIGTPAPSRTSMPDLLLSIQDNKPATPLKGLSSSLSAKPPSAGTAPVIDLLDNLAANMPSPENNGSAYPSIVAFESSSLRINATFTNFSSDDYNDFIFQAAVPKFLELHLDPASSNSLPASGKGSITQSLKITNSHHGKKTLVMRMRITYKVNNKDKLEEGQVSNFPNEL